MVGNRTEVKINCCGINKGINLTTHRELRECSTISLYVDVLQYVMKITTFDFHNKGF